MKTDKIQSGADLEVTIALRLTEVEARALDALVGYGDKAFIEAFLDHFYKKLGKHYMQPHAEGISSLFKTIRRELPQHLSRADAARRAWRGEKL